MGGTVGVLIKKPTVAEKELDEHTKRVIKVERSSRRQFQHMNENIVAGEVDKEVGQYYKISNKVLGKGCSGPVRVCTHKMSGVKYALKQLVLKKVDASIYAEIKIMAELDHPHVMRIEEYFQTAENLYLILELCAGGSLLTLLNKQKSHKFNEARGCELVSMMLSSIRYLHENGIVHRDIKLDNFLCDSDEANTCIKLTDFGFSEHIVPGQLLTKSMGTAYYIAPEVLLKSYDFKCDIWSLGVSTYVLLTGQYPFPGEEDTDIHRNVLNMAINYQSPIIKPLTINAKDFISKCLQRDVNKRMSAAEAQAHPWFREMKLEEREKVLQQTLDSLRNFATKKKLTKVFAQVLSHALSPRQRSKFLKEFLKLDIEYKGLVSFEDMKNVLQKDLQVTAEDAENIFSSIDEEKKGIIHFHQFIAASMEINIISESCVRLAFEKLSRRQTLIRKEDLIGLLGCDATSEEVEAMLLEADVQHGQAIDYAKFKSILYNCELPTTLEMMFSRPAITRRESSMRSKVSMRSVASNRSGASEGPERPLQQEASSLRKIG